MKIFEQCKQCRKRTFCHWGEYEYWQIAHDNDCPHFNQNEQTNFYQLIKSPEALAEKLVYFSDSHHGAVWFGFARNGFREGFDSKEEAVAATLEWLGKEVEK